MSVYKIMTSLPKTEAVFTDDIMAYDSGTVIKLVSITDMVKKVLLEEVAYAVVKCSSCGQWGARRCECKRCGAPIE